MPPKTSWRAGGSHSRPNSTKTGTKAIRARDKAIMEAAALTDPEERGRALAEIETLHPPGVTAANGGITLIRRA